ncbi:hypothetical protein B0H19DRAFT_1247880 [Mycena capillaripes]|nr:hypothetical protein B0H19DRAFT_1247880 [Mycena capillaripes]
MSAHTQAPTMYSLPNELLVAIAVAGQESRVVDSLETVFNLRTEWTLSHLSHRFRDVIVSAPELWTFAEVNLEAEGSAEIFSRYLEGSGTCSISVTIRYLRRTRFCYAAARSDRAAYQSHMAVEDDDLYGVGDAVA